MPAMTSSTTAWPNNAFQPVQPDVALAGGKRRRMDATQGGTSGMPVTACVQCAHAGKAHQCSQNRRTIGCRRCNEQRLGCSFRGGTCVRALCMVPSQTRSLGVFALPEDLEVPAIFRNLDMSLRVILNETRVLRQTMEDVERQVAVLQGEMADVRRTLHDQPSPTSRASSPARCDDEHDTPSTPWMEQDTAAPEHHLSAMIAGQPALGRPRPNQTDVPATVHCGEDEHEVSSEACECPKRGEAVCKRRYPLGPATVWGAPMATSPT